MRGRWEIALIAVGCIVWLVGCGSNSAKRPTAVASTAASSTPKAPTHTANREASKSPQQVLADAASALRGADGYELQGTITEGGQQLQLQLLVDARQSLEMKATIGGTAYQVLRGPLASYVRGNASFWTRHLGARGAVLANRWIRTSTAAGLSALGNFEPATMARCLAEDHGTLSIAGTTSVNGQRAIVLRDAGNLPGTQPGKLAVATTGPPYPLRLTATGHQRSGGRIDVCNNGRASTYYQGTLTFSRYDRVPPIQAPTHAIQSPGATNA